MPIMPSQNNVPSHGNPLLSARDNVQHKHVFWWHFLRVAQAYRCQQIGHLVSLVVASLKIVASKRCICGQEHKRSTKGAHRGAGLELGDRWWV